MPVYKKSLCSTLKLQKEGFDIRMRRLAFYGGIDVQWTLPLGSPEDVRNEVKERIAEMAPGGGYIVASAHRVQPDIPFENLMAMYEATKEFGKYPIQT